jgi:predicted MFS family arabinose efflux permease
MTSVRQVTAFCALAALAEVLFYAAIAPLLPSLDRAFGLGHALGGLLVATYSIGFTLGTFPAVVFTSRLGPRATMAGGLVCVAAGSLMFSGSSHIALLFAGRAIAGFGGAHFFTAAMALAVGYAGAANRGATIGTFFSGYDAGSAAGPLLGTAAAAFGRGPVFGVLAVVQVAVAGLTRLAPRITAEPRSDLRAILGHLRSEHVRVGLWITILSQFAIGMLVVSGSYRIDEAGGSALTIAWAFVGLAVLSMIGEPIIGRISDARGERPPIAVALLMAVASLAYLIMVESRFAIVVLIAQGGALLMLTATPGWALLFDAVDNRGGSVGDASLLSNLFTGPAEAVGAVLAGLLHNAGGAGLSFGVLGSVSLISVYVIYRDGRSGKSQLIGLSPASE